MSGMNEEKSCSSSGMSSPNSQKSKVACAPARSKRLKHCMKCEEHCTSNKTVSKCKKCLHLIPKEFPQNRLPTTFEVLCRYQMIKESSDGNTTNAVVSELMNLWTKLKVYTKARSSIYRRVESLWKEYQLLKRYPKEKRKQTYWMKFNNLVDDCKGLFDIIGNEKTIGNSEEAFHLKMTEKDWMFYENMKKSSQVGERVDLKRKEVRDKLNSDKEKATASFNDQKSSSQDVTKEESSIKHLCEDDEENSKTLDDPKDLQKSRKSNVPVIKMETDTAPPPTVLAKCECCGVEGDRETFYSTKKRFCMKRCAHSYSARHRSRSEKKPQTHRPSLNLLKVPFEKQSSFFERPNKRRRSSLLSNKERENLLLPSDARKVKDLTQNFQWGSYLDSTGSIAAPVKCFAHAPLGDLFSGIDGRFKIEVPNLDIPVNAKVFWIAQILKVAGYKVKFRYLGMGDNNSLDIWANLGEDVKWVGWSARSQTPLCCPLTCNNNQSDWKKFLYDQILQAHTLPPSYSDDIRNGLKFPVKENMRVEIMDKQQLSQNRIGIVDKVLSGRLCIRYEDGNNPDDIFWCHAKSTVIHPIGWSEAIGHDLKVRDELKGKYKNVPDFENAGAELLYQPPEVKENVEHFKEGMKLEAIDPLKLANICVATVAKVLKGGYLMISIDGLDVIENKCFCHHRTSTSIFPPGFCETNNVKLTPPAGYGKDFDWEKYLVEQCAPAAPFSLFASNEQKHSFREGMKLEAVDLLEPTLICVATVARVIGNVLRIHFDGWEDDYDQWIDAASPNIFPVGWCELVGHLLQPPNDDPVKPSKKDSCFDDHHDIYRKRQRKGGKRARKSGGKSDEPAAADEATPSEAEESSVHSPSKTNGISNQLVPAPNMLSPISNGENLSPPAANGTDLERH